MQSIATAPPGLSSEAHHAHPGVGSTFLKHFIRSPLHAWAAFIDPERERVDSAVFRFGRAWHCALFEPSEFDARYTTGHDAGPATKRAVLLQQVLDGQVKLEQLVSLPDELSPTTKEGKALIAEISGRGDVPVAASDMQFVAEWLPKLQGREVLGAEAIRKIRKMASIARALPISRVVFDQQGEHGVAEQSLVITDDDSGVLLKIRPDYMLTPCAAFPNGLIIDGKSTTDADVNGFGRQVWNLDYGLQAAVYTRVYQRVFGTSERPEFLWLAQEKDAPHAARYYSASRDLIAHYDARLSAILPKVAQCQQTGIWPGYPETVEPLSLPVWAQRAMQGAAA